MIRRVIELLREATKAKPITKQEILDVLLAEYPDIESTDNAYAPTRRGMANTLSINVPTLLRTKYSLKVKSVPPHESGKPNTAYYIAR